MTDEIELLGRAITDAEEVTVLTGAGVSTESGIPDFRSEGGLWDRYDRDQFHLRRFQTDPAGFWADWLDVREEVFPGDAAPNPAHESLADLVDAGAVDTLVTQNTDGLHQAAGVPDDEVIELHGSTDVVECSGTSCRRRIAAEPIRDRARDSDLPPTCPDCGEPLKPGAVLFGESLPEYAHFTAHARAEGSDVFIVVGSSLTVEPAASLPETAVDRGATLATINLEPTAMEGRAAYTIREKAGTALPALADEVLN